MFEIENFSQRYLQYKKLYHQTLKIQLMINDKNDKSADYIILKIAVSYTHTFVPRYKISRRDNPLLRI